MLEINIISTENNRGKITFFKIKDIVPLYFKLDLKD